MQLMIQRPGGHDFKSSQLPKTFKGERGGSAVDDELLAELLAISAKSSSGDRFQDDESNISGVDDIKHNTTTQIDENGTQRVKTSVEKGGAFENRQTVEQDETKTSESTKKEKKLKETTTLGRDMPPCEKSYKTMPSEKFGDRELSAPTRIKPVELTTSHSEGTLTSKESYQSGDEEDHEILAELQAMDMDASRDGVGSENCSMVFKNITKPVELEDSEDDELLAELQALDADATIEAAFLVKPGKKRLSMIREAGNSEQELPESDETGKHMGDGDCSKLESFNKTVAKVEESGNLSAKQDSPPSRNSVEMPPLPKTFAGDRGGTAEDAELLAELRAISLKSGSANRFKDDENSSLKENEIGNENDKTPSQSVSPLKKTRPDGNKRNLLNRNLLKRNRGKVNEEKVKLPGDSAIDMSSSEGEVTIKDSGDTSKKIDDSGSQFMTSDTSTTKEISTPTQDVMAVTAENFEDSLNSKQWKIRKAAYSMLKLWLSEKANGERGSNVLDGNAIVPSLDQVVVKIVKETNVSALDEALSFAVSYADQCKDASNAEHAGNICAALLKGPALSARAITVQLAKELLLKLMEVGRDGCCSLHSVVEVLLTDGLNSKKPKVVLNSISLAFETAITFGAHTLPLDIVSSNASKALSHSNKAVRENGLKLIAELCRFLGSKDSLDHVISTMKSAQVADLDVLLKNQEQPSSPSTELRFMKKSTASSVAPSAEMIAALKAASDEEKAKKFALRIAVNIIAKINETDFATKMKEKKWSEKVSALDILIQCGGDKPYKLCQPGASIDYCPLIRDLKSHLGHTHFAVKSKVLIALGMLAEGVGEKLFSYLRPMLCDVLKLSKDKKIVQACHSCLDSFFGNVIGFDNLMEKDDAILSAVDDKSHPLVRKCALEFLRRCIERTGTAGPRGSIDVGNAENITEMCCVKVNDQDAGVREEACQVLDLLLKNNNTAIKAVSERHVNKLEKKNPRAYKTIQKTILHATTGATGAISQAKKLSLPEGKKVVPSKEKHTPRVLKTKPLQTKFDKESAASSTKATIKKKLPQHRGGVPDFVVDIDEKNIPSEEDSYDFLTKLNIANWGAAEELDGIVSGLSSTKWQSRKMAIDSLASFLRSNEAKDADPSCAVHVLIFLKSKTKNFKENNFNLVKALMEVLLSVCDLYLLGKRQLEVWICEAAITLAVGKISDKKLSNDACKLLTALCEVQLPEIIITLSIKVIKPVKSPLPHEGLLTWCKSFCNDFGASTLGKSLTNCVKWVVEECGSTNTKVRTAGLSLIGEMHSQVGPVLKALIMSNDGIDSSLRAQIENLLVSSPFDSTSAKVSRQRKCFAVESEHDGESAASLAIDVPKTDLVATLPSNCLARMATKEGKIAWKIRKEALDEVESACSQCTGLLSTSPNCMKGLIALCRALKERLIDLQSNLKPLAARNIAHVLGSVDSKSQAKLARIVCGPLIVAAMNDNKKPMRDASLEALGKCINKTDIEGGGANQLSLKSFMTALTAEIGNAEYKAIGLPSVLELASKKAEFFPHLDSISTSKDKTLEKEFAAMTVACLTSSKADTRSAAERLLENCVNSHTLSLQSIEKGVNNLTQAEQRNVRLILNSIDIDRSHKSPNKHTPKSSQSISPTTQSQPSQIHLKDEKSNEEEITHVHAKAKISSNKQSSLRRAGLKEKKPIEAGRTVIRPSSQQSRNSHASSKRDDNSSSGSLNNLLSDATFLPLLANNGTTSTKAQRTSMSNRSRDPWPEYPEEPSGKDILKSLKKIWSPLLSPSSIGILFPRGGIGRQDDVASGCSLLSHALTVLHTNGQEHILTEQIDLVNKWLAFSICSRESTVGMQAIIPLIAKLFSFLRQIQYQMTDSESRMLLPYLVEKAGVAKERFRGMLLDLLESLASDDIYPLVKYGSITCISVIEMSTSPKTRVLATRECQLCVEKSGLAGIGKKGTQIVAKSLSMEQRSENRSAYLDLIETIIQKMNGDINKYINICGNSNLSIKAKELVEERWKRPKNSSAAKRRPATVQPRPKLRSGQGMADKRKSKSSAQVVPTSEVKTNDSQSMSKPASISDELSHELPTLSLKGSKTGRNLDMTLSGPSKDISVGPFKFSFNSPNDTSSESKTKVPLSSTATGIAAPLRERMKKISEHRQAEKVFNAIMFDVDDLLSQPTPLLDEKDISLKTVTGLRHIHAALTTHGIVQTDKGQVVLEELRKAVEENLPYCVARLTSVLGFGFRFGTLLNPDGLSTPLLSVSIAGLMAIFTDSTLSMLIPAEVLILVIRRAASGLLDRRLIGNLKGSNHGLDSATAVKISKAINKLAVQASLGTIRHVSLQSLISLQLQICSACVQEGVAITDVSNIHNRMSRIITKLCLRVIQTEESEASPFSGIRVDVALLLRTLEDVLQKARSIKGLTVSFPQSISRGVIDDKFICDDRMVPLLTMGRNLMLHLLKSKDSEGKLEEIKDMVESLGFSEVSLTARLFHNCCNELGLGTIQSSKSKTYDEDHLSELIFAVGRAKEEEDKMYAFDDLREFMRKHEEINIEDHLANLSVPFREYVLQELNNPNPFRPPLSSDSRSILSGYSGDSRSAMSSMSRYSTSDSNVLKSTRSLLSTYSDDSSRTFMSGCSIDIDNRPSTTESTTDRVRRLKSKIQAIKANAQSMIDLGSVDETDKSSKPIQ